MLVESARELLTNKKQGLGVEISVGKFLFDTNTRLVHENYKRAKTVSEMGWGPSRMSCPRDRTALRGCMGMTMSRGSGAPFPNRSFKIG